ncbi:hypothetical protein JYK00_01275 [Thermosipho ferrireducens]|uniref:Uncharacterized protein n=1 Tax=Thermosipho ferrireducens TaxID=2571116 RepID=A0ABX7S6I8_9BACT|nr:hypothetical protein [Thermosipho ferrireducens]QTA38201.1 hypothetical protein JYK00_01275 [Thermosipho ferrireducens]
MVRAYALTANDGTGRIHDGYYNKEIAGKIDEINTKSWQADRKVVQSSLFQIGLAGIIAVAGGSPSTLAGKFIVGVGSGAASITRVCFKNRKEKV